MMNIGFTSNAFVFLGVVKILHNFNSCPFDFCDLTISNPSWYPSTKLNNVHSTIRAHVIQIKTIDCVEIKIGLEFSAHKSAAQKEILKCATE